MNSTFRKIAVAAFFVISAVAIFGALSCSKAKLNDGEYVASGDGRNGPVTVKITVTDGKVSDAVCTNEDETDFAKPAIQAAIDVFKANGSTKGFDAVSGSTITSKAVVKALDDAFALAQGKTLAVAKYSDTTTDIVIIGAGGAGLAAAIEARELGKNVIVLEKMGNVGGNTLSATGGLNASETKYQAAKGITDSNEQYYQDTMKGGYNKNDPALVRNMVEKSSETVDWLVSLGADLTDVGKMAGSTNSRTHRPTGGAAVGAYLVPVLEKVAKEKGADIRLKNKVVDIIEKDGAAVGVKVEGDNGNYTVNAKAVIIATGGFGANPDMVVSYKADLAGFGTTNHKGATGDAFEWVKKFNGVLIQMDEIQTHPTVVPGKGTMITEAVRGNGAIIVNRAGKRFGSEMATRDVMSADILAQEGKTAFLVFDNDVRKSLKAIEGYVKSGLLTEDDTIEGLAKKLSIPADAFKATMDSYAALVKSGKDDSEFGRKASEMPRALTEAPFYAVEIGPAIHHTMGGIKINVNAEVVNSSGAAVPGLYAAGEVTGGVHGGNRLGGNAVADIIVYGKIAADSAAAYISK